MPKYTRCYDGNGTQSKVLTPGLTPQDVQLKELEKRALERYKQDVFSVPSKVAPPWPLNIPPLLGKTRKNLSLTRKGQVLVNGQEMCLRQKQG